MEIHKDATAQVPGVDRDAGLRNGDDERAAARRALEQTREAFWAVCEPVNPPMLARDYVNYLCARNLANVDTVTKNQPRRAAFYAALTTYLHAYSHLADELELAGYTPREVTSIEKEVRFFEDVVREVRLAAGEQS